MLKISPSLFQELRRHALNSYPQECCGILVGKDGDEGKEVRRVHPSQNLVAGQAADRYEVDPREVIKVSESCRAKGEEILGFYHSHPDCAPRPSRFDRENAHWDRHIYLILAVWAGREVEARAWLWHEAGRIFVGEPMELT